MRCSPLLTVLLESWQYRVFTCDPVRCPQPGTMGALKRTQSLGGMETGAEQVVTLGPDGECANECTANASGAYIKHVGHVWTVPMLVGQTACFRSHKLRR